MKIRQQNLMAIMPVFMLLILLVSIMAYRVQSQEIKWGMEEEARSLVIGVSEMLSKDSIESLAAGVSEDDPQISEQLVNPLQTVIKWNEIRRIDIFSPDGKGWYYSTMPEQRDSALPSDDIVQQLQALPVFVSDVNNSSKEFSSVDAYTIMHDSAGNAVAMVHVEILVDDILALSSNMLKRILIVAVLALLLAVLVAFITSGIISREINDLNREATGVVVADDSLIQGSGAIKEISDLSNTLNTMDNVLQEVLMRTKRRFVQNEQFRTNDDLARQFESFSWPDTSLNVAGRSLFVRSAGKRVPGEFYLLEHAENGQIAVVYGYCGGEGQLEQGLAASSAEYMLRDRLCSGAGIQESVGQISSAVSLEWCMISVWQDAGSISLNRFENGTWTEEPCSSQPCVLHRATGEVTRRIRILLELYRQESAEECVKQMVQSMHDEYSGLMIFVF